MALAGVDVAIVERRPDQELAGLRAGGLHSRTIKVLDQRGIADRFLPQGQVHKAVHFHAGTWELPAVGEVSAPTAMLIRPDGYVAWVGDPTQRGLAEALTTWFGPPDTIGSSPPS